MMEDKAFPMRTILNPQGNPYVSFINEGETIRLQLHSYDNIRPTFVVMDKRVIPQMIDILKEMQ